MKFKDGDIVICAYRSDGNSEIVTVFRHNTCASFSLHDLGWLSWRDPFSVEKYAAAHPHHALMTLEAAFAERYDFIHRHRDAIWSLL